jgi:hypothetical protein
MYHSKIKKQSIFVIALLLLIKHIKLLTIIMQNAAKTNYMSVVFEENSFHLTRKKQDSLHIVALTKVFELWSLGLNYCCTYYLHTKILRSPSPKNSVSI